MLQIPSSNSIKLLQCTESRIPKLIGKTVPKFAPFINRQVPGGGDRRGRKKTISDPCDFRVPRGASDPNDWSIMESSDHEVRGLMTGYAENGLRQTRVVIGI